MFVIIDQLLTTSRRSHEILIFLLIDRSKYGQTHIFFNIYQHRLVNYDCFLMMLLAGERQTNTYVANQLIELQFVLSFLHFVKYNLQIISEKFNSTHNAMRQFVIKIIFYLNCIFTIH